ncbi:TIGR00730 family Rossman fold protein [Undibacterium arcticum]|uniref:Cytokinin riboside 5'-monophosphate phosphoribohydrolase n=1 Tax=Undibacterium arcticum TaxID=1762892 RepID=A0ABV7F6Y0_9BURK
MKSICVYCGAATGASPAYADAARALAKVLVDDNIALVYGGGNVGLMGIIADEVMRRGGDVTGVIPRALLDQEVGHHGLSRLHIVKDMHERKAMMAQLSDGFIALPGGLGTLEELFEMLTWSQLKLHDKPVGLLNIGGFYDGLLGFMAHQVSENFLRPEHAALLIVESDPALLLRRCEAFVPTHVARWISRLAMGDLDTLE